MRDFFSNNGFWLLLSAAVLSVLLAVGSLFTDTAAIPNNLVNVLTTPFRDVANAGAAWYNDKQKYYRDVTVLEEENAALRKQVADMEDAIRQAERDSEENKRLRELLNLREQHRDFTELESCIVTEHSVTNWSSTMTINKGTLHGITKGNCVIDATGALVGVISEAGLNWSTVLNLVDTDSGVGAQVFRTGELGVAQGDFALMGQGRLRLDFLPANCQLITGDLVVTSGIGGYHPSGLVIGSVEEVLRDDSGSASYAILKPRSNSASLTQVIVVKAFDYSS